jgi:hypothetical protein
MKAMRRKILLSVIGLTAAIAAIFALNHVQERRQEMNQFFGADAAWFLTFADKTIDFCKIQGWMPSVEIPQDLGSLSISPSGRYAVRDLNEINPEQYGLAIVDNTLSKVVIAAPHDSGDTEVKWIHDEKYAVILHGVTMDDDFGTARIYVGNLSTGKIIYLADSTRSNCFEGGW